MLALWLKPMGDDGKLPIEMRQMEILDAFTMVELILNKN